MNNVIHVHWIQWMKFNQPILDAVITYFSTYNGADTTYKCHCDDVWLITWPIINNNGPINNRFFVNIVGYRLCSCVQTPLTIVAFCAAFWWHLLFMPQLNETQSRCGCETISQYTQKLSMQYKIRKSQIQNHNFQAGRLARSDVQIT